LTITGGSAEWQANVCGLPMHVVPLSGFPTFFLLHSSSPHGLLLKGDELSDRFSVILLAGTFFSDGHHVRVSRQSVWQPSNDL
jgi:hypothetical protein